jgi:hypothetical protein
MVMMMQDKRKSKIAAQGSSQVVQRVSNQASFKDSRKNTGITPTKKDSIVKTK